MDEEYWNKIGDYETENLARIQALHIHNTVTWFIRGSNGGYYCTLLGLQWRVRLRKVRDYRQVAYFN